MDGRDLGDGRERREGLRERWGGEGEVLASTAVSAGDGGGGTGQDRDG